jgi:hypothetical protein
MFVNIGCAKKETGTEGKLSLLLLLGLPDISPCAKAWPLDNCPAGKNVVL